MLLGIQALLHEALIPQKSRPWTPQPSIVGRDPRLQGLGLRVQGFGLKVLFWGDTPGVQGLGFRVQGVGLKVPFLGRYLRFRA